MWILQATQTDIEPQTIAIDGDLLIGRHQTADIQLHSPDISRRHAGLSVQDGQLIVIDLQSSNGTFVNGQRIENDVVVQENDMIRFAHIEYQVQKNDTEVIEKTEPTVAQQMSEQGMPSLTERAGDVQVNREGMPQNIGVPKPAPIPEGVDVTAKQAPVYSEQDKLPSDVSQDKEQQKNASIGLITVIFLILLVVIGLFVFK